MISTSPVRSCWFLPISFMVTSSGGRETLGLGLLSSPSHPARSGPQIFQGLFLQLPPPHTHTELTKRFGNMLMAAWVAATGRDPTLGVRIPEGRSPPPSGAGLLGSRGLGRNGGGSCFPRAAHCSWP